MAKGKHITDLDRLEIEHALKQRISFKKIAAKIGKHHSSVSREVLARRTASNKGAFGRVTNRCISRRSCDRRQLCIDKPDCLKRCSACRLCNEICTDFVEEICPKLEAAPYVCNGCSDESKCVLRKQYYLHNPAHSHYRDCLVQSRQGANITEGELRAIDALVTCPKCAAVMEFEMRLTQKQRLRYERAAPRGPPL